MNTVAQMQALNMILETIKAGALDAVKPMHLADLAACGQTLIFGHESEHSATWAEAQRLMNLVAKERSHA